MGHVVSMIFGPTGSWKTVTSLTSRGKIAVIDRDNQLALYTGNPAVGEVGGSQPTPMTKDWEGLKAGQPAVWVVSNSSDTTRERVAGFCEAAGLEHGDTLVDDPYSVLWELSLDAADVKFGKKDAKTDYYALRLPSVRLMNYYKYAPFDIVLTAHEKDKWSKTEKKPTGEITFSGEPTKTPRDIHFIWRMNDGLNGMEYVCQKEKGFKFKRGQTLPWQTLRSLYGDSGLYELLDRIDPGEEVDVDKQIETAVATFFDRSELAEGLKAELLAGIAAAKKEGKLAEYRKNPDVARKFYALTKAEQASILAVMG